MPCLQTNASKSSNGSNRLDAHFLDANVLLKEEACRNLERKFPDRLPLFGRQLQFIRLVADNPSLPCPVALAKKDWPIYRTARACKADVLLTGDRRNFGFLMHAPERADGLPIQPVADFLAAIG